MDTARLRENFAYVAMHGDEVALFFYSDLFLRHPELREMFPVSMAAQRDRLVRAIGKIVSDAGHLDQLTPYLRELGRYHRKFGALHSYLDKLLRNVEEWDRAEEETLDAVHADMSDPPDVPAVPPLPPLPRVPPSAAGRPAAVNEPADDWPLADGPVRPGPSGG